MKFLVLGSNGMAGHMIALYLKEKGHSVTGFARKESRHIATIVGDATDTKKLAETIESGKYDIIINCIGILNQFAEQNKDQAAFLNGYLPHFVAKITENSPTRIFHMSTDCVFSGRTGGYTEKSLKDGETFYDRSKALGELDDNKNITFRNSIVGPDINPQGIGLLNWFMKQNDEINGFSKAMWTGQTTLQLAKTMEKAATENVTGLYNMVPDHNISKYDLLLLFNKYLKNGALKINKVDGINADKTLVRTNFDFGYLIPNYETMISELADWMKAHKELYPHYVL